ncbi:glycosyltransferase family 2 protein [Sphingobacterium spiritivorum]|uniref:glycosyltransferase family 2 protein n=1 Tax=Sphingobacterium spiritivorum TaxID=258 RepID=UPI003DA43A19
MDKLVSVIIPIYNVENYIEQCLRSLFEQSYRNIEYIFVNDCSTDNSMSVLERITDEYKYRELFIKVIEHPVNKGLPTARNSGLKVASGDYVLHCDSDDWLALHMIEKLVIKAEESKADIVFCDIYTVLVRGEFSIYRQAKRASYVEYLKDFFVGTSQGSVCNKLVKRNIYCDNNITFPDGLPMYEDLRTIVQLFYYAQRIECVPEPLYYYVKYRDNSISIYNDRKNKEIGFDKVENVNAITDFLIKNNVKGLNPEIGILKLRAKQNLLVNGDTVEVLKKWKNLFPESNIYIHLNNFPLHYRIITKSVLWNIWFIPKVWLLAKNIKIKLKIN